jgi:hypothetical protein
LTSGGAEIDITDTGTGSHWWRRRMGFNLIKDGSLVTNLTRTGYAILMNSARLSFNTGDMSVCDLFILSGSFQVLDECSTADGGFFSLYSVGTYKTFTADAGTDIITSTSHGYAEADIIMLESTGTLPAPLSQFTQYFVKYINANTYQVALTSGGAAVNITDTGSGTHQSNKAKTVTTADTMVVKNTDDSDSTANLNGTINASVTTVVHTSYAGIPALSYIRIDSEWMFVLTSDSATTLEVKRAMFGTTAASHTTGADIYIMGNFPESLYALDVAKGWGKVAKSNGKYVCSARLIIGRPDQTAVTLIVSSLYLLECTDVSIAGSITYGTIAQLGLGWVDDGWGIYTGYYFNGGTLYYVNLTSYENAMLNLFGATAYKCSTTGMTLFFGLMNIMTSFLNALDTTDYIGFGNAKQCKMYRSWINNQRISASSIMLDWEDIWENFKVEQETVYFLQSGGDTTFRNFEMVDSAFDLGIFGFAASGTKTYIDCILNENTSGFWSGVLTVFKKTVAMNAVTPEGTAIPNVNIKIFDKNLLLVHDVTTDALGEVDVQEVMYMYLDDDLVTMHDMNPFKFVVTKAGWKDKAFDVEIYESKVYEFVMENAGLTEDEN